MIEFAHDPAHDHVDTRPDRVIAMSLSSNQPHVQAGSQSAQAAHAAVVAIMLDDGTCQSMVALQLASGENVIYSSAPVAPQLVPEVMEEAVLFAESMGFLLDDTGWARLPADQRDQLFERTRAFHPPRPKQLDAPLERQKPKDTLAAVARLFAVFGAACALSAAGCATGMSAEQRTRDAEIHYELGTTMLQQGDPQGALKEYMTASQENSDMAQAHAGLGFLYAFSFARPAEAEEEFRRAIDIEPQFSEALNNFGAFYLQQKRYAEAAPLFERALANPLYPERFIAEGNLGWALYKSGQAEKGISRLRGALLVAPKYCKGWRELGTIYSETGKLDAAAEAYGRYAAACPDVADARLQHAKVLGRLSRGEEARAELEACSRLKPDKDAASVAECERFLKELGPNSPN
jgi:type IV pilus biogenesis/stability protein PilW